MSISFGSGFHVGDGIGWSVRSSCLGSLMGLLLSVSPDQPRTFLKVPHGLAGPFKDRGWRLPKKFRNP
jgi:hypothetical protein